MDDLTLQMMKLHAKGYCCAQVILILALEAQGKINEDLVRSVGGLCFGINGAAKSAEPFLEGHVLSLLCRKRVR